VGEGIEEGDDVGEAGVRWRCAGYLGEELDLIEGSLGVAGRGFDYFESGVAVESVAEG
jgi:hypothetical protein